MECLNCKYEAQHRFWPNCGQKTSTRRYSLSYFFKHGLLHGILHIDSGILFTIKELFTRPGHSIREYIEGKRVRHFNYLTLLVVLATVGFFLTEVTTITLSELFDLEGDSSAYLTSLENLSTEYPKTFILLTIPLYAFTSFLWFRKAEQNFTEHLVINSYKAAAELIIMSLFWLFTLVYTNKTGLCVAYTLMGVITVLYSTWYYYQYFSTFGYKRIALIFRSVMASLTISILTGIITVITMVMRG